MKIIKKYHMFFREKKNLIYKLKFFINAFICWYILNFFSFQNPGENQCYFLFLFF